jgi:c-di-GMP-binding flagellar brake protein YcgR
MAGKKQQVFTVAYQPTRKYRRFNLQLPVTLSFSSESSDQTLDAVSRNISLGGLLLESDRAVEVGIHVNLCIAVQGPQSSRQVRLQAQGEVVRVQRLDSSAGFAIAVACKRPLMEVRESLSLAC